MSCPVQFHPHHVAVFCSDINRSIQWWEEVFGAKKKFSNEFFLPDYGKAQMAWMQIDSLYIELYDFPGLAPETNEQYWKTYGTKHLCLYVADEDWDKMIAHLESKGVEIFVRAEHPPEKLSKPTSTKVIFLNDPDGNRVEVQQTFTPGDY